MKNANETSKSERNIDFLLSEVLTAEILNPEEMSCVRGGENTGGEPIIVHPKF